MRESYYDWRAPEYDDFWKQRRRYVGAPESWFAERDAILELVAGLPARRTLDVACGTGFVTRHLRGEVTGLDQSARMLEVARRQASAATLVQGSAFELPFPDASFERVFTSHFWTPRAARACRIPGRSPPRGTGARGAGYRAA